MPEELTFQGYWHEILDEINSGFFLFDNVLKVLSMKGIIYGRIFNRGRTV